MIPSCHKKVICQISGNSVWHFFRSSKKATPRPSGGVSDGPAGGVPSAPKTLLSMARKQDSGGLSPGPAYIISWIVEAAGCMVAKQGALPHQALTWGFPPYPKAV